ncbi:MAG: hypothetical protein WBF77_08355 [Sulfurimonadaceae bacterium]
MRFFSTVIAVMTLTLTLTANEHYLLPEHKSDLMHTLKGKIERANNITIITHGLDNPSLSKSIEKALKKEAHFRLLTTDIRNAAYYAKYKNTTVKIPTSDRLTDNYSLNILLIDESDVCFSSLSFSEAILKGNIGEVICTTNREEIAFAKEIEKRFTERFEEYNQ